MKWFPLSYYIYGLGGNRSELVSGPNQLRLQFQNISKNTVEWAYVVYNEPYRVRFNGHGPLEALKSASQIVNPSSHAPYNGHAPWFN